MVEPARIIQQVFRYQVGEKRCGNNNGEGYKKAQSYFSLYRIMHASKRDELEAIEFTDSLSNIGY
jgi:hypothetical protein